MKELSIFLCTKQQPSCSQYNPGVFHPQVSASQSNTTEHYALAGTVLAYCKHGGMEKVSMFSAPVPTPAT